VFSSRWSLTQNDLLTSVDISDDGSTAITGSSDRTIHVWDLDTGEHKLTLIEQWGGISSVAF
jgi:WD40 repeat protein